MSEPRSKDSESQSENQERKSMRFSAEGTSVEVRRLLSDMGGPRHDKLAVNALVRSVSRFLEQSISPKRLYNLWRGDAHPEHHEVEAIRAAAALEKVERGRAYARELGKIFDGAATRLVSIDADFYGHDIARLRAGAREVGSADSALAALEGLARPSGLEGGE